MLEILKKGKVNREYLYERQWFDTGIFIYLRDRKSLNLSLSSE